MNDLALLPRTLVEEYAGVVRLVLSGTRPFLAVAARSHELLVDLAKVEFLGLTVVHVHQVVQLRRLIQVEREFLALLALPSLRRVEASSAATKQLSREVDLP